MRTALLVVDMQVSLLEDETWEPERLLERVSGLEAAARAANAAILYVTDRRVEPHPALHPNLRPRDADERIEKGYCDSFLETTLQTTLDSLGVERLIICGLQTDFCIDTTCRRAASLGYHVLLAADAHSTFDRDDLSAEAVIRHHNRILADFPAGRGRVTTAPSRSITFR